MLLNLKLLFSFFNLLLFLSPSILARSIQENRTATTIATIQDHPYCRHPRLLPPFKTSNIVTIQDYHHHPRLLDPLKINRTYPLNSISIRPSPPQSLFTPRTERPPPRMETTNADYEPTPILLNACMLNAKYILSYVLRDNSQLRLMHFKRTCQVRWFPKLKEDNIH